MAQQATRKRRPQGCLPSLIAIVVLLALIAVAAGHKGAAKADGCAGPIFRAPHSCMDVARELARAEKPSAKYAATYTACLGDGYSSSECAASIRSACAASKLPAVDCADGQEQAEGSEEAAKHAEAG